MLVGAGVFRPGFPKELRKERAGEGCQQFKKGSRLRRPLTTPCARPLGRGAQGLGGPGQARLSGPPFWAAMLLASTNGQLQQPAKHKGPRRPPGCGEGSPKTWASGPRGRTPWDCGMCWACWDAGTLGLRQASAWAAGSQSHSSGWGKLAPLWLQPQHLACRILLLACCRGRC